MSYRKTKQKYRHSFLSIVSVIALLSFIASGTASAINLSDQLNFNIFQFKDKQIYNLNKLSQEKTKQLSKTEINLQAAQVDVNESTNERRSMEKEVLDLKSNITELSNMFVKVDKYAPDAAGNSYVPCQCTYFTKEKRPDLPNNLGNANTWYINAKAQGWNVGNKPKKGAIGVSNEGFYGHTVYVRSVSLDGLTVTIEEDNYIYPCNKNTRTVPARNFQYIYELN